VTRRNSGSRPAVLIGEYRQQAELASQMQTRIDDGDRRQALKFYTREVMHGDIDDLDGWLAEWPPWPDIVALTENIARINRAIEDYRLPDSLDITAPTLLLTGTEGPPHLQDGVRAVDEAVSDGRLVEFKAVGHGGPVDAPERVITAVPSFIESKQTVVFEPGR